MKREYWCTSHIDVYQANYAKWKKTAKKDYALYDSIYMILIEKAITETENRPVIFLWLLHGGKLITKSPQGAF